MAKLCCSMHLQDNELLSLAFDQDTQGLIVITPVSSQALNFDVTLLLLLCFFLLTFLFVSLMQCTAVQLPRGEVRSV